jgi:hypothetical protein
VILKWANSRPRVQRCLYSVMLAPPVHAYQPSRPFTNWVPGEEEEEGLQAAWCDLKCEQAQRLFQGDCRAVLSLSAFVAQLAERMRLYLNREVLFRTTAEANSLTSWVRTTEETNVFAAMRTSCCRYCCMHRQ